MCRWGSLDVHYLVSSFCVCLSVDVHVGVFRKEFMYLCVCVLQEVMLSFHSEPVDPGEEVYQRYPSVLRLDILASRLTDPAVPRRLLACVLCALKAAGSCGVHTELNAGDEFMADIYAKLGFITVVSESDKSSQDTVYMGRLF